MTVTSSSLNDSPAVPAMNVPSVGVLGCGHWGQNLVRNFAQLGALRAVCDTSESCRRRAQELAPQVDFFQDYKDVLRLPSLEAVVIATPAETHFAMVRDALACGKHVFCEK